MEIPGLPPAQIFDRLDDAQAERILPDGAFRLLTLISPERIRGPRRSVTLGEILSLDLAIEDQERRKLLLGAVPERKVDELEERVDTTMERLREADSLAPGAKRALAGFFGGATGDDRKVTLAASSTLVDPDRSLFPHQKRAAAAVERFLYREDGRAMLHLPTGVGKTRTAMSIVASHLRSRDKGLVIWLAATRELLEQAAAEFELTWQAVGDRKVECVRFWSDFNPPIDEVADGIVVAGLAKVHAFGKKRSRLWDLGDRTSMVVFDEAHQAVATTYQDTVETLVTRNPRTPLLGLSATPGRTWADSEIDLAVAALFYGNKVTIRFNGENPIRRLTDEGYLANVDFSLLNVEPGLELSDADREAITTALDIPETLAARLGEDEQRNLRIAQRLIELADTHKRILVFSPSVSNALLLASLCRGFGLHADAVTSMSDVSHRRHAIQRFRRLDGKKRVLVNFGVLTTGFDAPGASAALIARPTKSLVLYSQMVGRVIRGPRAGGTERCEVVTVVDTTLPGFGDVADAFMNWEDVWSTE